MALENKLGMTNSADLARVKREYVDIFYAHRHDPETPLEETAGALITACLLYTSISSLREISDIVWSKK